MQKHALFHIEAGKVAATINAKYAKADAMLNGGAAYANASSANGVAIMHQKKKRACNLFKFLFTPKRPKLTSCESVFLFYIVNSLIRETTNFGSGLQLGSTVTLNASMIVSV
ncbi:hypothetical protein H8K32_19485 [Undibacterium jejuense]|uniref:Uncharacterized protein n=1 Tax=Undibacterium jejuense TaxID=1344949 RepID=A0A923HKT6_9BURK|nr:hypothetical protein [Undibacterium jejuense]MBC3864288.1 hypothetical protein [Undibacterium jejuense]